MANQAGVQASIGNGQTMNADAAIYWRLLVAAVAAACGVWVVATEGTRTYARQKYLYDNRNRPGFNPAWSPDSPYAYHLSGRAVDVGSQVGFILTLVSKAFYARAGAYGFRPTVKGEPWHFEWRLEWVRADIRASVGTTPASPAPAPYVSPEQKDDNEMITPEAQRFITDTVRAVVTRDSRYRLYRNTETQKLVAVRWDVPVGDPARTIYPNDDAHARRLRDPYQVFGDSPEQAKGLSPQEWASLHRLIDGTDVAYQKK
jgi:D-alanyl-D-alanine carboxypeptidase